jgi:hypothetical protein
MIVEPSAVNRPLTTQLLLPISRQSNGGEERSTSSAASARSGGGLAAARNSGSTSSGWNAIDDRAARYSCRMSASSTPAFSAEFSAESSSTRASPG